MCVILVGVVALTVAGCGAPRIGTVLYFLNIAATYRHTKRT